MTSVTLDSDQNSFHPSLGGIPNLINVPTIVETLLQGYSSNIHIKRLEASLKILSNNS